MALTGTTNTSANTALRYLGSNQMQASSALAKLSSGSRIVKASDDAASLAVGTKVKADVTALKQAQMNTQQASSLLQVADGGMARISDILQRMKALSVQASSGQLSDTERGYLNEEFSQLQDQVDQIADTTRFNGVSLLNGAAGKTLSYAATNTLDNLSASGVAVKMTGGPVAGTYTIAFSAAASTFTLNFGDVAVGTLAYTIQVASTANPVIDGIVNFQEAGISVRLDNFIASNDLGTGVAGAITVAGTGGLSFQVGVLAADTIVVSISDVDGNALGVASTSIETQGNATQASLLIDDAIEEMNRARANLGAMMSRFEFTSANLATSVENLDAARSTLMDVDMAGEMTNFSSLQVLTQAGVAMLAQANQMPQQLLRLLQ